MNNNENNQHVLGGSASASSASPSRTPASTRPRYRKPKRSMTPYNYFFSEERLKILAEKEALAEQKKRGAEEASARGVGTLSLCPTCSGEIVPATASSDDGSGSGAGSSSSSRPRYVSSSSMASRTDSNITVSSGSNRSTSGNSSSASGDDDNDETSSIKSSSASASASASTYTSTSGGGNTKIKTNRSFSTSTSNSGSSSTRSSKNGMKHKLCTCDSILCGTTATASPKNSNNGSPNQKKKNGKKKPHGMISFQDLNKEISRRWKIVKPEDLARYKEMSKQDTARYRREMKEYEEEQAIARGLIEQQITASGVALPTNQTSGVPVATSNNGQQWLPQLSIPNGSNAGNNGIPSSTTSATMQQVILQQQQQQQLLLQQLHPYQEVGGSPMMTGQQNSSSRGIDGNDNANAIIALLLQQLINAQQQSQGSSPKGLLDILRQYLQQQIGQQQEAQASGPAAQASVAFMTPAQASAPALTVPSMALPTYRPNGPINPLPTANTNIMAQMQGQLQQQQAGMSSSSSSSINSTTSALSNTPAVAAAVTDADAGGLLAPGSASAIALAKYGLQQLQSQLQQQQQLIPPKVVMPPPPRKLASRSSSPQSSFAASSITDGISTMGGSRQFTASTAFLQQVLDAANKNGSMSFSASSASSSQGEDGDNANGGSEVSGPSADNAELHVHHVRRLKKRNDKASQKVADITQEGDAAAANAAAAVSVKSKKPKTSDTSSSCSFSSMSTLATFKDQIEGSQDNSSSKLTIDKVLAAVSPRKHRLPSNVDQNPPNKKVRVADPAIMANLKKQDSGSDNSDELSATFDWAKRGIPSEMSSVSASCSDSGSDNGNGSGAVSDKVETESFSSITGLLDAAKAADKKR